MGCTGLSQGFVNDLAEDYNHCFVYASVASNPDIQLDTLWYKYFRTWYLADLWNSYQPTRNLDEIYVKW